MSFKWALRLSAATAIILGVAGPIGLASVARAEAPAAETLTAATPRVTASGHTFTAPEGWSLATRGPMITLRPPEADSALVIVDLKAKSAEEAVAQAWALYRPELKLTLEISNPGPAANGWDEVWAFVYKTSPNDKAVLQALARRAGDSWAVVLIDFKIATVEKRGAPLSQLIGSLRPKGYNRESFAGRTPHPLDAARIEAMKTFVAEGMKAYDIPGVGFSLIDGGKVVFEGGVGVRALGGTDKVDARTRFMAASNTKAMTTLLLAEAVDAGKLRWDEKATEAYPGFRLGDPALTQRVEIRNLVCACTGIPRQDLEWAFGDPALPASSVFDTLATMQPTSKFGEVFQYSNLMASAAGYIAASKLEPDLELGAAYDKAIKDDVFDPLGMTDSTFDMARAQTGDYALAHSFDIDGHLQRASMAINDKIAPARPAGGMWTTSHDLSRYVQMELAKGLTPDGKRLVSEANLLERRRPQIMLGEDSSYGMGLMVDRHLGIDVVHHGGDLVGYHSDMIWLPQYGIGAVILTNSDSGPLLRGPFLRKLLELAFDGKPEADEQVRVGSANFHAQLKKEREQLAFPADPVASAKLADRYSNPVLGSFTVLRSQGHVRFALLGYTTEVATLKNPDGTTTFVAVDPGVAAAELVQGEKDGKRVMILRDAQHEYVYTEAAAK